MQMTQLIQKLGRNDVKLVGRDNFLVFMLFFAVTIAGILRFGMPWLNDYLLEQNVLNETTFISSLEEIYPMLVTYFALYTGPLLVGIIFGFMLLDEKDDNTIKAMLVTPVPLRNYLTYRVTAPILLAFLIVLGQILFINQALIPPLPLLFVVTGASLTAPIITLFFSTFADNKVQGFALSKFTGVAGWTIMLGWFVATPLQFLFGLFPPFWISKAYWMVLEGNDLWWLAWGIGIVTQLVLIALLMRRFTTTIYQKS